MEFCIPLLGEESKVMFSVVSSDHLITDEWLKRSKLFSPLEIREYNQHKVEKRKQSYALGRWATKRGIHNCFPTVDLMDITVDSSPLGFPVIRGVSNTQVSISHIKGIGVAAIFDEAHPIGIDIEKVLSERLPVFKHLATQKDKERLEEIEEVSELWKYGSLWTLKEALAKILRTGLTIDFDLLELKDVSFDEGIVNCSFSHFPQFEGVSLLFDDYALGIVYQKIGSYDFREFYSNLKESFIV